MRKPKHVALLRSGNRLVVEPTTPRIKDILTPHLRYVEKDWKRGKEKMQRVKLDLPLFDEIEWECYGEDHKGRLATSYGFRERIIKLLEAKGYVVETRWASKAEAEARKLLDETVYKPRWDRLDELLKSGFEFRYKQKRALEIISTEDNARISCHAGWGKGTLIMMACVMHPKAIIDVVTKRIPVLRTRLYPELAMNLPSVGIIGGGQRITGRRVMCISGDSLHHGRPKADFVFVDEGHEACADKFAEKLGMYDRAKMFAFSASWDMRADNKDMRGEAMFGPVRMEVPYEKGVEHGIVVPIEVVWTDVIMDENPCSNIVDDTEKKRLGIWTNDYRNQLIAKDAIQYDDDTQTLITVETLEHALNLKELLPDYTIAYSGQGLKDSDIAWFRKKFPDTFNPMTREKLTRLTQKFEKGKLKKAIATTVWNVGVNFRNLEVLIRADAGGSAINDTQIPGRNSRTNDKVVKKKGKHKKKFIGIVRDYKDQFDSGFKGKAVRREKNYDRNKWKQHHPQRGKRSSLRQLFEMGSLV